MSYKRPIATGAEFDTGTNDTKFGSPKALKDSHNVPSVVPSTALNFMQSDGTDWESKTINYSGATEKASTSNAITIGFTDADPAMVYTLLDEAVTSLTFTTTGAVINKLVKWHIKGNYAITFPTTDVIKAESSEDYGGVQARVEIEVGVNPTDGTYEFWYNIINEA